MNNKQKVVIAFILNYKYLRIARTQEQSDHITSVTYFEHFLTCFNIFAINFRRYGFIVVLGNENLFNFYYPECAVEHRILSEYIVPMLRAVGSIFLYNAKLWTRNLTLKIEKCIFLWALKIQIFEVQQENIFQHTRIFAVP